MDLHGMGLLTESSEEMSGSRPHAAENGLLLASLTDGILPGLGRSTHTPDLLLGGAGGSGEHTVKQLCFSSFNTFCVTSLKYLLVWANGSICHMLQEILELENSGCQQTGLDQLGLSVLCRWLSSLTRQLSFRTASRAPGNQSFDTAPCYVCHVTFFLLIS